MAKAKIKIDMKQINKFRFWIGLGVLALFLLILTYFQMTSLAGEKEKKNYFDKMKAVKGLNDFKNEKFLPAWNEREEKLKKQRDDIWAKAWEPQRGIQTWFEKPFWEKQIDTKTGNLVWRQVENVNVPAKLGRDASGDWAWKYPTEPIDGTSLDIFKDTLYITQFHNFEKELLDARFPVEFSGGFDVLMAPVTWKRGATPSNEEVWLAQEEFWVKRELIRDLQKALQSLSEMISDPIGKDEQTPAEVKARKRFYNNLWELDLMFETQDRDRFVSPRSKITNVHVDHRIQTLDNPVSGSKTEFLLKQGTTVFPIRVQGEPLGYAQSREFTKERITLPTTFDPSKDFTVEQLFSQKNSPIKMIQDLKINFSSHRLASKSAVARSPNVLKMEKAGDAAGAGAPGGEGAPPGGPGGPMMGGSPDGPGGRPGFGRGMGMGMMGGAGTAKNPTLINNIERDRYLHATDQCRHLPFAMNLVLDQSVMHEVIATLVNSRLRVQVTQFHYQHSNSFKPGNFLAGSASGTAQGGPGEGGPGGPGMRPGFGPGGPGSFGPGGPGSPDGGMMRPGGFAPGGPGGFRPPGGGPGVPGGSMAVDSSSSEVNLVEFSIYGVASLFERPGAPPVAEKKEEEANK